MIRRFRTPLIFVLIAAFGADTALADGAGSTIAPPPTPPAVGSRIGVAAPSGPVFTRAPQSIPDTARPVAASAPPASPAAVVQSPGSATPDLFSRRGGNVPAAIRDLQQQSIKITSLGRDGGSRAYLGEAPNGRFQVFYAAPDGDYLMIGFLFRSGGANVTSGQVERMMKRFGEAAKSAPALDSSKLPEISSDSTPSAEVDVPIVDWFRSRGMTVTQFGKKEGGVDAYFVETPKKDGAQGVMQTFYVLPDNHYAVAGFLTKRGGTNVTGMQIADMKFAAQAKAAEDAAPKSSSVAPGMAPPSVPPALASADDAKPAPAIVPSVPTEVATPAPTIAAPDVQPAPVAAAPVAAPIPTFEISSKPVLASEPYRSRIDSRAFVEALKTTVWFKVGLDNDNGVNLPVLYMVDDPQCPYCQATWQKLKPLVFGRKLQVRVIMIAGLKGSDPLARSILSRANPSQAWLDGEGSIRGVPIKEGPLPGSQDYDRAGNFLQVNAAFINRFTIDRTPFLAYVKPDGTMYSSTGLPEDLDAFLAAMKP